jgi:hypothetical protein
VGGGNYSIGGSAHNRTRTAQVICPPGSYCQGAIPILCPMGRYGDRPGLSDSACSGTACPTDSPAFIDLSVGYHWLKWKQRALF